MTSIGMQPTADARAALLTWQRLGLDGAIGRWSFPASLPVFAGHFPGSPLLPGVYQLAAADVLLQLACPDWRLGALVRAKWMAPVRPDQELEITVRWRGTPVQEADATMRLAGVIVATVRVRPS